MTKARNLAILLFDDAEVLDFCGPFEVFSVASNQFEEPPLNVLTVAEKTPITARNGLSVNPHFTLATCPSLDQTFCLSPEAWALAERSTTNH